MQKMRLFVLWSVEDEIEISGSLRSGELYAKRPYSLVHAENLYSNSMEHIIACIAHHLALLAICMPYYVDRYDDGDNRALVFSYDAVRLQLIHLGYIETSYTRTCIITKQPATWIL